MVIAQRKTKCLTTASVFVNGWAKQPVYEIPLANSAASCERFATISFPIPVPKKNTIEKTEPTNGAAPAKALTSEAVKPEAAAKAKKQSPKRGVKKESSSKAAPKSPARNPSKKVATAKKPPAKKAGEPSDDEVRIRAYFIAERRVQFSLGGDPANDWIQAREELLTELSTGAAR